MKIQNQMKPTFSLEPTDSSANSSPYLHAYINSLVDKIQFLEKTLTNVLESQCQNFKDITSTISKIVTAKQSTPMHISEAPSLSIKQQQPEKVEEKKPTTAISTTNVPQLTPKKDTPTNSKIQKTPAKHIKAIEIVGDSMLLGIDEKQMRNKNIVRIRPHSGAKSYDMVDLIKVTARRKPDAVIVHCGSNDFNNLNDKIDTVKHMEEVFSHLSKEAPDTKVAYSLTFNRYDKLKKTVREDTLHRINSTNERMKVLCNRYGVAIIDNSNITRSLLDKAKGWHPNGDGKHALVDNWQRFISSI